ncbi:hypothetical protein [Zunongwangia atlantica]|uniref:Uncharacterized protein n=1 Tax=Zunongwangia atlantica 22II14-10F7 TaxID=1185767 RepID=A0A1Y1SXJ5_9FLAO|nr:hypothetical protein [Zunongwangia atlantica]ORL43468.1 hypothetical protein IIF7_20661 [Zunongwangia atlantica 22II14-10F7]
MNTISELNKISKKNSKKIRTITLYNLISFWGVLIFGIFGMLIGIYFLPIEKLNIENVSIIVLIPICLILLSYYMLEVNLKFLKGSKRSYWILLVFFAIQCVGIGMANTKFNFELGGIPLNFTIRFGEFFLKINVAAICLTLYLLSFKKNLPEFLENLKQKNSQNYGR